MPAQARESRRSSNSSQSGSHTSGSDRREKTKSPQSYVGVEARRGSLRPQPAERVRLGSRANSAPYISAVHQTQELGRGPKERGSNDQLYQLRTPTEARSPVFPSPTYPTGLNGAKPDNGDDFIEANVAVLGNEGVGKSTFIKRSLDHPTGGDGTACSRIVWAGGNRYRVKMFEIALDDVGISDDDVLQWPTSLRDVRVHAVMSLYDVGSRESFQHLPEILAAINKMALISILVACKCDLATEQRRLEPGMIERKAMSSFRDLAVLQTSASDPDGYKSAVSTLLRAMINLAGDPTYPFESPRRRTMPSTSAPVSPRTNNDPGHSRAMSERTLINTQDFAHYRHDSSQASSLSDFKPGLATPRIAEEGSQSFLNLDDSHTEDSVTQSSGSVRASDDSDDDSDDAPVEPHSEIQGPSDENGWSFDSLVDRLLSLPTTKADNKYAAVFLALYRKLSAPGTLLEAIVHRFDALENNDTPQMTRIVSQLRYLSVMEQWIRTYPGDFAHPTTLRRARTFVSKINKIRIYTAAALEMSVGLDLVTEDDDTDWASSDKDRGLKDTDDALSTWSHRASSLLDDPDFDFPDEMGSLSLGKQRRDTAVTTASSKNSTTVMSEIASRQAQTLVPVPKIAITKLQWRALMAIPVENIAREMTRIDWIMFSSIRPRDLVRYVSLSSDQKAECKSLANVSRMVDHFNHVRDWVANYVLLRDKPKHRALMLEKMMQVARKLRELNNYNSLGAILAGLHSSAVHRLTATRDLISPETNKDWMKLEILMAQTRSFTAYRLAWENSSSERIPYLPLPIRDLIGAEQGNKTFVGDPAHKRINWRKFEVIGDVLVGIQRAQGLPYRSSTLGQRNDEIRALLLNGRLMRDDDALYERSVQIEATATPGDRRGFREFFKR